MSKWLLRNEGRISVYDRKLQLKCDKAGPEININKAKYLTTAEERKNLEVDGGLEIKRTASFKFLGSQYQAAR